MEAMSHTCFRDGLNIRFLDFKIDLFGRNQIEQPTYTEIYALFFGAGRKCLLYIISFVCEVKFKLKFKMFKVYLSAYIHAIDEQM